MQSIRSLPVGVVDLSLEQQAAVVGGSVLIRKAVGWAYSRCRNFMVKVYEYGKCAADTFIACAHAAMTAAS